MSKEYLQQMLSISKARMITDLDEIRKIAGVVLQQQKNLCDKTLSDYQRYYRQHGAKMCQDAHNNNLSIKEYIESLPRSKSMKYWLRAVFIHGLANDIEQLRLQVSTARKQGKMEFSREMRDRASLLTTELLKMEPDFRRNHWKNRTHDGQGYTETGDKNKKKGKRNELRLLPADWQKKTISNVKNEFREAALIQSISGCRTSELVNGVHVVAQGSKLFFRIKGAKTNQGHGQKWREFSIGTSDKTWALYIRACDKGGLTHQLNRPESYRKHITSAARSAQIFGVSPICFRQQMASDLKYSGYPAEITAKVMGHCSDLTAQKHYGLKHKGQHIKISDVKAAQPVRIHKPRSKKPSPKHKKPGLGPGPS